MFRDFQKIGLKRFNAKIRNASSDTYFQRYVMGMPHSPAGEPSAWRFLDWDSYEEEPVIHYGDHCHRCWPAGNHPAVDAKMAKRRKKPDSWDDDEEVSSVIGSSFSSSDDD